MPINKDIKKVMVIGSGPIVIGQAAEFDYAGTQACRVLKDAGLDVVLVNSNPATIMTDKALADEIYLEPLTAETVKRIIEKEKPDSLLAGLGGQTGLTIAMQLSKDGYLDRMGVKLLGTNAEAIDKAEDRKMFRDTMESINQPVIPSEIANDVETAVEIANKIGYPIIIRPALQITKKNSELLPKPDLTFPLSLRFLLKNISSVGKKLSLKQCVTAQATALLFAAWKTLTPLVFTQATVSLLLLLFHLQMKNSRCFAKHLLILLMLSASSAAVTASLLLTPTAWTMQLLRLIPEFLVHLLLQVRQRAIPLQK